MEENEKLILFEKLQRTLINTDKMVCPICGQHDAQAHHYFQTITAFDKFSEELANKFVSLQIRHILECTLNNVEELSLDVSDVLLKDLTIHDMEEFNSEVSDDDEEFEDCTETDSDEEEELELIEERLKESNSDCNINVKFKFVSGLSVEGKFKSSDSIHFVVLWLAVATSIPKENLALRVNNQLLENNKLLNNKSTLEEMNIIPGTLVHCFCRSQ